MEAFFAKPETANVLEYESDGNPFVVSYLAAGEGKDPDDENEEHNEQPDSTEDRPNAELQVEARADVPAPVSNAGRGSVVSISDGNFSWSSGHVLHLNDVTVPKGKPLPLERHMHHHFVLINSIAFQA